MQVQDLRPSGSIRGQKPGMKLYLSAVLPGGEAQGRTGRCDASRIIVKSWTIPRTKNSQSGMGEVSPLEK